MKRVLLFLLIIVVVSTFSYRAGYRCAETAAEPKHDTVWMTKKIHVPSPAPIAERILDTRLLFVSVPILADSSGGTPDSTIIAFPVEQKEYADSNYHAWVSGYRPQLDSITLFQKTQIITTTVTQKAPRFGLGISAGIAAGYFLTPSGWQPGAGPAVSVGFYYRF